LGYTCAGAIDRRSSRESALKGRIVDIIAATDNLVLEVHPEGSSGPACLLLRRQDEEAGAVVIYAPEVQHLIRILTAAREKATQWTDSGQSTGEP